MPFSVPPIPKPATASRRGAPPHRPGRGRQAPPRWYSFTPPQWHVFSPPLTTVGRQCIARVSTGFYFGSQKNRWASSSSRNPDNRGVFEVQGEQSLQARILGSPNELLHEQFRGNDHYALELWDEEPSLSAGKRVTMRFRLNADLDWVLKGTVREVEQHRVLIEGDALLAAAGRD